jgi:hypothetical protein
MMCADRPKNLMPCLLHWISIGSVVVGLLLATWGAWQTAAAVIIDEKTADTLSGTYWGRNEALKQSLMDQSHEASAGLRLVVFGSIFQIIGIVLQTAAARQRE